jgi:type VI secretion system ImpB/VipA family protein
MQSSEFPFRIVVLAELSGTPEVQLPRVQDRRLITFTRQHFAEIMRAQRPRVVLSPSGFAKSWNIEFSDLRDFGTEQVASRAAAQGASESEAQMIATTAVSDPIFATVCSAWHGMDLLLQTTQSNAEIVVQCWNISKRELIRDLQRAVEFDQSALFRRVYSDLIDTFGSGAAGCVLADYSLTRHPNDIELAEKISNVAAVAGCPFLIGASPQICCLESWKDLNPDFDPAWFPGLTNTLKLLSLRQSDDADFVFTVLPMFRPREQSSLPAGIWINSVYLAACGMANAFRGDTFDNQPWVVPGADSMRFEAEIPEHLADNLRLIGLNALGQNDLIGSVASMQSITFPNRNTGGLPALLSDCRVWQRLRLALRRRGTWSDVEHIPHDLQEWLSAISESRIEAGVHYEIQQSGPRLLLRIQRGFPPVNSRIELPLCRTDISPEQEIKPGTRLLIMADLCRGMTLESPRAPLAWRKAITINNDNFGMVFKGYCRDAAIRLKIGNALNEGGAWIKTELRFDDLDDFDPENLARQIATCNDLLKDRAQLVDVAAYAESHRDRWARLQEASVLEGGLRGLALKLEGWASGVGDGELFPFPIANLHEGIGPWAEAGLLKVDGEIPMMKEALLRYQEYVDAGRRDYPPEPGRLRATLFEIDNIISAQLRPVLENEDFSRLERLWRGLRRLVDSISGHAEVRTFDLESAEAVFDSSDFSTQLLETLNQSLPESGEDEGVTFFLMDYAFDELPSLPHILDLSVGRNLFVVCNITLEAVGDEQSNIAPSDAILRQVIASSAAEKLILVSGQTVVRREYAKDGGHPAKFVFNREGPSVPALLGPNIYRAAEVLAGVADRLTAASTVEDRCQSVRDALKECGLDCRPLGGAMFIRSTEEA